MYRPHISDGFCERVCGSVLVFFTCCLRASVPCYTIISCPRLLKVTKTSAFTRRPQRTNPSKSSRYYWCAAETENRPMKAEIYQLLELRSGVMNNGNTAGYCRPCRYTKRYIIVPHDVENRRNILTMFVNSCTNKDYFKLQRKREMVNHIHILLFYIIKCNALIQLITPEMIILILQEITMVHFLKFEISL